MEGLVKEGSETLEEDMNEDVKDAAIIAAAQRVEHYEIEAMARPAPLPICWASGKPLLYWSKPSRKKRKPMLNSPNWPKALTLLLNTLGKRNQRPRRARSRPLSFGKN